MTVAALSEAPPRRFTYRAHSYQLKVLKSDKGLVFLGGGVGVGKTDVGTLWMLMRSRYSPPGVRGILAANTYPQLFDVTLHKLYEKLNAWGIAHKPTVLPRSHGPMTLELWNGERWVEVLCRSMERFENLSGIEAGWAWLDEVWQTDRQAYDLILARVRDKRMPNNQILLTTTLDDPTSWMHDEFVKQFDGERMEVVYAPTEENAGHLRSGYIDDLRRSYPDRLFKRMVMAEWVSLEAGQVYYAFTRSVHVTDEAEFDPALPILWAHDFNIGEGKPMSSCLCQIKKGTAPDGKVRPELHVFDELILESSDTNESIKEFVSRGPYKEAEPWHKQGKAGVRVYGDASGGAKDTRSKQTDYQLLRDAGFPDQRVPKANPPIRDRHNAVNALLRNAAGDVRLRIHPRCKTLATGLETVTLKAGAQYLEKETRAQHVTTALGYLVVQEFPIVTRKPAAVSSVGWIGL